MQKQVIARLDQLSPMRDIKSNKRSLTGRLRVATGAGVSFESSLERDWLICLDFHPDIKLILEQPMTICYDSGGARRYTPDMLARYEKADGQSHVIVYEVKPLEELRKSWATYRPRFCAAVSFCRDRAWRFKIVTEKHIRTPFLDNAKFLRKYRSNAIQELYRDQLLYSLRALGPTTPQALLAFSYLQFERKMAALSELWRMVAIGEICTDLSQPITMSSTIWVGQP